jgi:tetratricopeptide (TPR) repeat protein
MRACMVELREEVLEGLTRFAPERFANADRVGAGNNAVVFRAWDEHLQREVVFKVALPDVLVEELGPEQLERLGIAEGVRHYIHETQAGHRYTLLREARLLSRVDHPNVIPVLDIGLLDDGALAVVMPFLEAGGLDEHEFSGPWADVLDVALQIGRGLEAIHAAGILHRDFKPNNILFDRFGRPRIADLGLGCRFDDAEAMAEWVGTAEYMAPEVLEHRLRDVRDDLYAFCMILYRMLYGHGPFSTTAAREAGRVTPAVREGGMPKALHEILVRGLTPDPEQRWPDMRTLLRALERVRTPTRSRWPWVAAGVAATFVVGLVVTTRPVHANECEEIAAELTTSWNDQMALELRGVMGTRTGADALTSWSTRWAAVRAQECELAKSAGVAPEPSPCTESTRDRFRATVATLRKPHLREGLRFAAVIAELPPPEYCLDHPEDGDHGQGGLLELRNLDVEIGTLVQIGDYESAQQRQSEYMKLARANFASFDIARASFWRGELRRIGHDLDAAQQDFDWALAQAKAVGAEEFVAEILMKLAAIAGERGHVRAVDAYAQSAALGFSTTNPDRMAELLVVQGTGLLAGDEGDRRRAIELLHDAVAQREDQYARYGGSREVIGHASEALASGLIAVGDYERAIEAAKRSLAIHIESFNDGTLRAHDLRRVLFTAQIGSRREYEAEQTMWQVLLPLQIDKNYATYFDEIAWFVTRAVSLGAGEFARDWKMRARQEAQQIGFALSNHEFEEGP